MDTRLIFLDIDGTFIEPGRMEAPASAVEAVRAAQANGHRVGPSWRPTGWSAPWRPGTPPTAARR